MKKFRIGETEYSIENKSTTDVSRFNLVWESFTEIKKPSVRTGEVSGKPATWEKYYGSLAQALCGFVKCYTQDFKEGDKLKDIETRLDVSYGIVCSMLNKLSEVDKAIVEEWKNVKVII